MAKAANETPATPEVSPDPRVSLRSAPAAAPPASPTFKFVAFIAIVAALNFCSALAIYWATSNCFSAIQTVILHFVVDRRIRAGSLKI